MIYVTPYQVKHGEGHYCSRKCKGKKMSETPRPWAKPNEKTVHSAGYLMVWAPEHPKASRGRIFEHILVAEQKIGRYLQSGEQVHHIDFDKQNNEPENLLIVSASEHQKYHPQAPAKRITMNCQECGKSFETKPCRAHASNPINQRKYCSLECRYKAWGRQMVIRRVAIKKGES